MSFKIPKVGAKFKEGGAIGKRYWWKENRRSGRRKKVCHLFALSCH